MVNALNEIEKNSMVKDKKFKNNAIENYNYHYGNELNIIDT